MGIELGSGPDIRGSRPGQIDVHDFFDDTRPSGHHHHAVGKVNSFVDGVSHKQDGGICLLPDPEQLRLQEFPCLGIEGGERLVHEKHFRIAGQRPRDGYPLLHAARELIRIAVAEGSQPEKPEQVFGFVRALVL